MAAAVTRSTVIGFDGAAAARQEDLRSPPSRSWRQNIGVLENKESDFALAVQHGRFRVNAYQQRGTIAYAMRTVPFQAKTISELTCLTSARISMPRGLILRRNNRLRGNRRRWHRCFRTSIKPVRQHHHHRRSNRFLHRDIKFSISARSEPPTASRRALARGRGSDILLVGEIRDSTLSTPRSRRPRPVTWCSRRCTRRTRRRRSIVSSRSIRPTSRPKCATCCRPRAGDHPLRLRAAPTRAPRPAAEILVTRRCAIRCATCRSR